MPYQLRVIIASMRIAFAFCLICMLRLLQRLASPRLLAEAPLTAPRAYSHTSAGLLHVALPRPRRFRGVPVLFLLVDRLALPRLSCCFLYPYLINSIPSISPFIYTTVGVRR